MSGMKKLEQYQATSLLQKIYQSNVPMPPLFWIQATHAETICWTIVAWVLQSRSKGPLRVTIYCTEPFYLYIIKKYTNLLDCKEIEWVHTYQNGWLDLDSILSRARTAPRSLWVLLDAMVCDSVDLATWTRFLHSWADQKSALLIGSHSNGARVSEDLSRQIAFLQRYCGGILEISDAGESERGNKLGSIAGLSIASAKIPAMFHYVHHGKRTTEHLLLSVERGELKCSLRITKKQVDREPEKPAAINTLQQLATFKVMLSAEEQQQKANIGLPYLKAQTENIEPQTGLPDIVYYAEKVDDLDEEDPDADLEF